MRSYRKLAPAQESLKEGEFLVAKDVAEGGIKIYQIFESIDEFLEYQELHRKHFYEIINGKQRVYFDIDIPVDNTDNITIQDIEKFITRFKVYIRFYLGTDKINIYTSLPVENRYSYHFVVLDKYVNSNTENKKLAITIVNSYTDKMSKTKSYNESIDGLIKYVDLSLYKSNQLLRLLGSTKIGSKSIKVPYSIIEHKEEKDIFKDSLIVYNNIHM